MGLGRCVLTLDFLSISFTEILKCMHSEKKLANTFLKARIQGNILLAGVYFTFRVTLVRNAELTPPPLLFS